MESIPVNPPVTYSGRNGFGHASSSNIYDWVNDVDNARENRRDTLKTQDVKIDTRTDSQKRWIRKQKEIQGLKFQETTTNYLKDYSERATLKSKLS